MKVEFHTGVGDETGFACRLLRKAYRMVTPVLVRAPAAVLARLDRELWTFAEREFIAHLRFAQPGPMPAAASRTPIWLVDGERPAAGPAVMVNLGAGLPSSLDGLERIIEIVARDAEAERGGRERWRAYRALGIDVQHHNRQEARDG